MGLLSWFEQWADRRLRRSQIRILYQNQAAIDYLQSQYNDFTQMKIPVDPEISTALDMFDTNTCTAIVRLTGQKPLPEHESQQLLQINNGLKNIYLGINEGTRLFRSEFGMPAGDIVPFASRFSPAKGWDAFSDAEWDRMVERALRGRNS